MTHILFILASTTPSTTTSSTTTTTTKKPPARKRRDAENIEWNVKSLIETGSIRPENIANEKMLETWTTSTSMPMEERIHKLESGDDLAPYFGVCTNNTRVFSDPKKIYGYYQRSVIVENPVQNVTVTNNVWLKHSDMCDLKLKYRGTSPFTYCMKVIATNNVSVSSSSQDVECNQSDWKQTDELEITYKHFFPKHSNSYIVEFCIKNEVSEVKMPIGVQFYEGIKFIPQFLLYANHIIFFHCSSITFPALSSYRTGNFLSSSGRIYRFWSSILCSE